jgi:hypothetical protein
MGSGPCWGNRSHSANQEFLSFCWTQKFTSVLKKSSQWTPSSTRFIPSKHYYPYTVESTLILSKQTHPRATKRCTLPRSFDRKFASSTAPFWVACCIPLPSDRFLVVILTMSDEECAPWSSYTDGARYLVWVGGFIGALTQSVPLNFHVTAKALYCGMWTRC